MQTNYNVDEKGFYGEFGGAFIPEMLYPNVEELRQQYLSLSAEPEFQAKFHSLLKEYVGRPTPLLCQAFIGEIQYQDLPQT